MIGWQLDDFKFGVEEPEIRVLRVYTSPCPPSFNELSRIVLLDGNASLGLLFSRHVKGR